MTLLLSSDAFAARASVQVETLKKRPVVIPGDELETYGCKWAKPGFLHDGYVFNVHGSREEHKHIFQPPKGEVEEFVWIYFEEDQEWACVRRSLAIKYVIPPHELEAKVRQATL